MSQSFIERMLNVPAILSYYIRTFFFPKDLVVLHSWVVRDIELNTFFIPLFIVFSFTAALYVTGRVIYRKQKGRQLLFFSLWFLIGLFVHVQIVPIDTTVSDRYFYFPFVGLLAIIGLFIASLHISRPGVTVVGVGLGVIVLIVLSARTIIRNRDWVDQSTLIAHDIQISKDDYLLEHLYSSALLKENKDDEALFHIKKAMELYPDSKPAWTNLGVYYYKKGDVEQAKSSLQRAISLGDFYAAYENMAMIKYEHDSLIDAMDFTRKATSLFPNSEKLWFRRLLIGQKLRDYEEVSLSSRNCYYSGGNDYCFKIYQQVMQNSTVQ